MKGMHSRAIALALIVGGLLQACSGSRGTQAIPVAQQMATVNFSIVIPAATGITPKYVSSATKSAGITVSGGTPVVVNCTTTCSATLQAPVGTDTFTAQLFDAQNGAGNVLSQGTTSATIVAGTANSVNISFNGVVKTMVLGASASIVRGVASIIPLTVTAKDAAGNTIVGAYDAAIALSNSDTTGTTSLSAGSVANSTAAVSLNYNGGSTFGGTTITASSPSATTATLILANPCTRLVTPNRGLYPCDLQSAYALPSLSGGSGQTVAIVDALDDPNAEADLAVYRATFNLPPCTTANGCFRKVAQDGGTLYPTPDSGWAGEISLDLDMVSAVCPNCHILLVEANDEDLSSLGASVSEAVTLGANAVSNSYGGSEFSSETLSDHFFNHPGVAITASTGDDGYAGGVSYPASSRFVTAVGGTKLVTASNARGWTETAWFGTCSGGVVCGTGSGCSAYEAKPAWQKDTGCTKRMLADVSADADPASGVAVYDTYPTGGWRVFGGTSASAPIVGAVFALAGNASSIDASYPYQHSSGLYDVTSGTNGTCASDPAYFCTAQAGYDGPTGLGTPNGTGGLGAFSQAQRAALSYSPGESVTAVLAPVRHVCTERPARGKVACFALERLDSP